MVIATGKGACTGKHLLLRDLLRHVGETADVEFIEGDFAASMPVVPHQCRRSSSAGYQRAGFPIFTAMSCGRVASGEVKLDATWPDRVASLGYPVNAKWDGIGDTRVAIEPA